MINNAGVNQRTPSLELTTEAWDIILNVNLKGAFFCSQAAARYMVSHSGGKIINIASLLSSIGISTLAPYANKSGVVELTRVLAAEWACHEIRVNCIAPGYFHTEMK